MTAILGISVFLLLTYLLSENRQLISLKFVLTALGMQAALGVLILGIPAFEIPGVLRFLFVGANHFFIKILEFSDHGSRFIFGPLVDEDKIGAWIFAFRALPVIIFVSSCTAILYHFNILQRVIMVLAALMQKTLKISGAESLATCANIFIGQTEAPLVVRPFVAKMTRSELLLLMTGGMATVAGSVLAAFVGFLHSRIPEIGGHLLTASVMSAPASILIAKMLVPETLRPETAGQNYKLDLEARQANVLEAAAKGASEGLHVALNVAAMLIAFVAILYMANWFIAIFGELISFSTWGESLVPAVLKSGEEITLSLELIMAWLLAPVAFLMGVPWSEAFLVGSLLGKKIILNEFFAYLELTKVMNNLSDKSVIITSYALCGFANFSSIGIQIGGIGAIAPKRRGDLAKLGMRALYGGTIAAFLTACFASLLI